MTRLEAIRAIRNGTRVDTLFTPEEHGVSGKFMVMIYHLDICDFPRARQEAHDRIGPIHCLFYSGGSPHWIHITPKQLLGFIRRNYSRK
jgi:hypothetical protein